MPRTKQFDEKEVLNKAMELFWEKGFHATSMQDLVSHLGINRASLYDTFGGKDALFEAAFALYRKTSSGTLEALFEAATSVKEGFEKLFEKAIEESITDTCRKGCFVVNTTTELVPANDKILQEILQNNTNAENLFTGFVQKGIQTGELGSDKNANEIGLMLFALFSGMRVLAKVEPNRQKLQKIVNSGLSVLD